MVTIENGIEKSDDGSRVDGLFIVIFTGDVFIGSMKNETPLRIHFDDEVIVVLRNEAGDGHIHRFTARTGLQGIESGAINDQRFGCFQADREDRPFEFTIGANGQIEDAQRLPCKVEHAINGAPRLAVAPAQRAEENHIRPAGEIFKVEVPLQLIECSKVIECSPRAAGNSANREPARRKVRIRLQMRTFYTDRSEGCQNTGGRVILS